MRLLKRIASGTKVAISDQGNRSGAAEAREAPARALLASYLQQRRDQGHDRGDGFRPGDYPGGRAVFDAEPSLQIAVIRVALADLVRTLRDPIWEVNSLDRTRAFHLAGLLGELFRRGLPYTPDDVGRMLALIAADPCRHARILHLPMLAFVRDVKRWAADHELPGATQADLQRLREQLRVGRHRADLRRAMAVIDAILAGHDSGAAVIDAGDDWGYHASASLARMAPADRARWLAVLTHAATATAAKPSRAWLTRAGERIALLREERFKANLIAWLGFLDRPSCSTTRVDRFGRLHDSAVVADRNATLLKGLVWCCARFDDRAIARAVAAAAAACFARIPNVGPRSIRVGNACVAALGMMPGAEGIVQLEWLGQRVTYPPALRLVETALAAAARRAGPTPDDPDDPAAPAHRGDDRHRADRPVQG